MIFCSARRFTKPGQRDDQVDGEVVGDQRPPVGPAGRQLVGAVELAHDVAPHELPAEVRRAVVVAERVAGAAAHRGGPERDLAARPVVVAGLDGDALQVLGPGGVGVEVEQDLEDLIGRRGDLHGLRRLVSHRRILVQPGHGLPHQRRHRGSASPADDGVDRTMPSRRVNRRRPAEPGTVAVSVGRAHERAIRLQSPNMRGEDRRSATSV